ncbi:DNA adenine methylase [Burkholderia anthinoferrum]|uniref:DNA adenine methylase n=1 Tax=Burkholderia anthinoferrum TaxID=3090833 RepID=UPI0015E31957|nr:DNA adenine methylase [Burkholderia anthinoferrum]
MLYVLLAPTTRARPLLALCVSVERVPLATLRGGQSPDGIAPYALHAYRTGPLPSVEELRQFSARLQNAELYCGDFAQAVRGTTENDFIYLDPPYYYGSVRNRGEYGWNAFSDDDVERLIDEVRSADERGVRILISYNQAHTLRKALPGWHLTYAPVRRSIAGFSKGRKSVREYQLRNYE